MNFKRLALSFLVVIFSLILSMQIVQAGIQTSKQKGIAYVSWTANEYTRPDADLALAHLRATGADWISLLVTQYQDIITSTTIYTTTATPTDASLIHAISQAHSLGLKVMLKPHIDLSNDPKHWRGQIGQGFTEAQWLVWFTSYQSFINHYAQLAQVYGVDQFCVGTELSATQSQAPEWRTVIAGVRSLYSGPITYAANWGDETSLTWWDAVDYIGVDAFYPLTNKNNPSVAELKAAWNPYTTTLANLASSWNKTILFTEIGYRSQDGTNQHPWDWQAGGTIDLQEQADTYQAAFETVFNQSWFAGIFWWSWGTDSFEGGLCDDGYTPHDKPSEDLLRSWYGALPRTSTSPLVPEPDYSRTLDIYRDGWGTGWGDWSWDATVNMLTTNPVYSGTRSISVTAQAWGALSLHHANFDTSPYYWLEFFVRESAAGQQLRVFANDEQDTELLYLSLCRYSEGGVIEPGTWKRIRVPLPDLNAAQRLIQRIAIKNYSDQSSTFWVDEVRLIAATWRVYLPVAIRHSP